MIDPLFKGWLSFSSSLLLLCVIKVGAPPEVVARLEEEFNYNYNNISRSTSGICSGEDNQPDPALDQFMEAYCEMLTKYEEELTKPFKEAMLFCSRVECQLKALTISSTTDSGEITLIILYYVIILYIERKIEHLYFLLLFLNFVLFSRTPSSSGSWELLG